MDFLILNEATGSPEDFAKKIGIKRSTLLSHIRELRSIGININYSHYRKTYYYVDGKMIKSKFKGLPLDFRGMNDIRAGYTWGSEGNLQFYSSVCRPLKEYNHEISCIYL
jgi:biotin operon repressor